MNEELKARLDQVLNALADIRIPAVPTEQHMHELIKDALERHQIQAVHEARIQTGSRIDFLCGDIGIEVKQGEQPKTRLVQQATRYLANERLGALILVTTRGVNMPGEILGKPVVVFGLNKLWGVSLP